MSTSSCSTSSHSTCRSVQCTSCARAVDGDGTLRWMSTARPSAPPSRPVSPIVARPRARARLDGRQHVGRPAARRNPDQHVARLPVRLHLPREHALEPVVVADRRQDARVGRQRQRRPRRAARARTARPVPPRSAARRRRCRRCRTPAPSARPQRRRSARRPPRAPAPAARAGHARAAAIVSAKASSTRRVAVGGRHRLSVPRRPDPPRASRSAAMFAWNSCSVSWSGVVDLRRHLDLHRVVLAQRVPLPVLRHQQPAQVAVLLEHDAEQVPDLALEPVGRRPDAVHRRHARVRRRRRRTLSAQRAPAPTSPPGGRRPRSAARRASGPRAVTSVSTSNRERGSSRSARARREQVLARHDDGRPVDGGRRPGSSAAGHGGLERGDDRGSVHGVYPAFTTSFDSSIFFCSWMMP